MSRLSFIVPVYKPKILERCIKSLLEQSLTEFDVVYVLDGPDSEARSLIGRLMKKRPNHYKIIEIEHGGAPRARNEGFKHAKGQYIVFWDCDCIIEPHAAEGWCDILDQNSQVGFVYSGYKFLNEGGAINSEPFDPWTLRVRNYISTMNPIRRELVVPWKEDLKSLQDWDFWLTVVENGAKGKFLQGYSFSTLLPEAGSISGENCAEDVWLDRVDAVKKIHNLPERETCISSLDYKHDGVALAKLIDADYQDYPQFKPHRYKNIIQIGFSLKPDMAQTHAEMFKRDTKNYIFWMPNDINTIWREISFEAITKYSILLNATATQFVEDLTAKKMMEKAGFKVQILPMPMKNDLELKYLPEKPKWLVDIDPAFGKIFGLLDQSLPDIVMDVSSGAQKIEDYTGIVHFWADKTMSNGIKRMLMTGRKVLSNVQDPYCGYISDTQHPETFISEFVDTIRRTSKELIDTEAVNFYKQELDPTKLKEIINA